MKNTGSTEKDFVSGFEAVLCGEEMLLAYPAGRHAQFGSQPAKVTVVVPVFNGGARLKRCLQSIVDQSCRDYQVLVVDNGSNDGTLVEALEFADKHANFLVYQNAKNLGRIGNWNRALELARGEYVKPVMVNDYLLPSCLEQLAEILDKHSEVAMVRSSVTTLDNGNWHFGPLFDSSRNMTGPEAIEYGVTMGNPAAGPSAQMFRRSIYAREGFRFDSGMEWAADFDFAMRLFECGGLYYLRASLFVFELTNRFATTAGKTRAFRDEVEVIGRAVERNHARLTPECKASALARAESFYRNFCAQATTEEEHAKGDEIWQSARNRFQKLFLDYGFVQYEPHTFEPGNIAQSPKAIALFQSGFADAAQTTALALN